MKRRLLFLCLLYAVRAVSQAQEIEQLKLDLEKLVQLKLMLSQAKQGYTVLQKGYNEVLDAAKGNFDLHKNYLDALLQVSDKVRNAPGCKRIMANANIVQEESRKWLSQAKLLKVLRDNELVHIQEVFQQMGSDMTVNIDLLGMVLGSGKLRMSDAERLNVIETLVQKTDQQVLSLRKFIEGQKTLAAGRIQGQRDAESLRRLYGIH